MPYTLGALAGPDWQGTANRALLAVMNGVPGKFEGTTMTPREFITYYSTHANSATGIAVYRAAAATVARWDQEQRPVPVVETPVFVPPSAPVSSPVSPVAVPPVVRPSTPSNGPVHTPSSPADASGVVPVGATSSTLPMLAGVSALVAIFFLRRKGS